MEDKIGNSHFLQRCTESGDEFGRKIGNEANGVGKDCLFQTRQADGTHGRIQRREQEILCHDVRTGEPVEQSRLPGIGVTYERDDRPRGLFASVPMQAASSSDLFRSEEHTSELQSLMRIPYAV